MKLLKKMKDGGDESTVTGYWLIEWKRAFSIVLLKFEGDSREAYHEHAFNCFSWVLRGRLFEDFRTEHGTNCRWIPASWRPFITRRSTFHKVSSVGTSWVLSFRGPWAKTWREYRPLEGREVTLTHGRIEL